MAKAVLQGTVKGTRRRGDREVGRQHKGQDWTGLEFGDFEQLKIREWRRVFET